MALTMQVLPTSPPISTSNRIIRVVVGAASEGEVNEEISHETLTGGPIMRAAVADKDGGEDTPKRASPLIKMGHHMNVECALSTVRKRKMPDVAGFCTQDPFLAQWRDIGGPNPEIKKAF